LNSRSLIGDLIGLLLSVTLPVLTRVVTLALDGLGKMEEDEGQPTIRKEELHVLFAVAVANLKGFGYAWVC
jgi:hypothetical protein